MQRNKVNTHSNNTNSKYVFLINGPVLSMYTYLLVKDETSPPSVTPPSLPSIPPPSVASPVISIEYLTTSLLVLTAASATTLPTPDGTPDPTGTACPPMPTASKQSSSMGETDETEPVTSFALVLMTGPLTTWLSRETPPSPAVAAAAVPTTAPLGLELAVEETALREGRQLPSLLSAASVVPPDTAVVVVIVAAAPQDGTPGALLPVLMPVPVMVVLVQVLALLMVLLVLMLLAWLLYSGANFRRSCFQIAVDFWDRWSLFVCICVCAIYGKIYGPVRNGHTEHITRDSRACLLGAGGCI